MNSKSGFFTFKAAAKYLKIPQIHTKGCFQTKAAVKIMKRIVSFILTLLLLASVCLSSGCGLIDAFTGKIPTKYDNADKYTTGNGEFEGKVDTFSIWWLDGSVTVKTHKENTVKIVETANRELDDTFSLHWRYHYVEDYGNVLYVRYSASGNFDFGDLKKDVTVYLPENDGMDITVNVDVASVDLDMGGFENTLKELCILSNSGKVSAKVDNADEVRISGQNDEDVPEANRQFFFRANGTVDDLGISSSYAKVYAIAGSMRYADVATVFNDLHLSTGEAKKLSISNSGGNIYATVLKFDSIDLETFDGATELILAPDASFELSMKDKDRFNHKVTPKSVLVEFEDVVQDGSTYTVGSGEKKITVATDSTLRITQSD